MGAETERETETGTADGGLVRAIENGSESDRVREIESDGKIETETEIGTEIENEIGRALAIEIETGIEIEKIENGTAVDVDVIRALQF